MPCYVIAEMERIEDPEGLQRYIEAAPATIAAYGGRYVMRGVVPDALEGPEGGVRMSILEFPDAATARRWYASPEYAMLAPVRQAAAPTRLLLVEGDPPA